MIAFHAEYDSGDIQLQVEEISEAQFFKFDQLPEIPFKGSIAHAMIMQIVENKKHLNQDAFLFNLLKLHLRNAKSFVWF